MIFINSVGFPGENGLNCRVCEVCGKPITKALLIPVQSDYPWGKPQKDSAEMCETCCDDYIQNWNESDLWQQTDDY